MCPAVAQDKIAFALSGRSYRLVDRWIAAWWFVVVVVVHFRKLQFRYRLSVIVLIESV